MKRFLSILMFLMLVASATLPANAAPPTAYDNGDIATMKVSQDKIPDGSKARPWSMIHDWEASLKQAVTDVEGTFEWVSPGLKTQGNWSLPSWDNPRDRLIFYGNQRLLHKQLKQHIIDVGVLEQIAQVPDFKLRKQLFRLFMECSLKSYENDRPWDWKLFRDKVVADARFTGKVNLSFDGSTDLVAIAPDTTTTGGNAPPAGTQTNTPKLPAAPKRAEPKTSPSPSPSVSPQASPSPSVSPLPPAAPQSPPDADRDKKDDDKKQTPAASGQPASNKPSGAQSGTPASSDPSVNSSSQPSSNAGDLQGGSDPTNLSASPAAKH